MQNLSEIHLTDGRTAEQYLSKIKDPADRYWATEGIWECLRRNWPIHILHIESLGRKLRRQSMRQD